MRKFGIELELVGMRPCHFYEKHRDIYSRRDDRYRIGDLTFNVGTDCSITHSRSMELRTDPTALVGLIPPLVALLKTDKIKGQADLYCGMHIHIDFDQELRHKYRRQIAEYFNTKWSDKLQKTYRSHPVRMSYCGHGKATSTRYSAINLVSEFPTIEFRLFNAVLNSRYICKAIRDALAVTDDIQEYVSKQPPENPPSPQEAFRYYVSRAPVPF